MEPADLDDAAGRLARLLTAADGWLTDADGSRRLEFASTLELAALEPQPAPADVWAIDGGQALVADARCVQVLVTRAARVRFRGGVCVLEEEGQLRTHLLGTGQSAVALGRLGLDAVADGTSVDANLLRDRWEWDAVSRAVDEADAGALVLVDGDLQPDWRIPSTMLAELMARAEARRVTLAGVTKHSSLSRGGAPLLGFLERLAQAELGPRARWWCPVATTRPDVGPGLQVVAARLDPEARFAFRVDLPGGVDAASVLGALSAIANDAAFPGYPYPLTVADWLAACPGWVRADVRMALDEALAERGVDEDMRERAFADRHRLMERA